MEDGEFDYGDDGGEGAEDDVANPDDEISVPSLARTTSDNKAINEILKIRKASTVDEYEHIIKDTIERNSTADANDSTEDTSSTPQNVSNKKVKTVEDLIADLEYAETDEELHNIYKLIKKRLSYSI